MLHCTTRPGPMIDTILDYAIDHSAVFAGVLVVVVVAAAATAIWAYGRYHERQTRRRGAELIG
jgi:hypothetical protein